MIRWDERLPQVLALVLLTLGAIPVLPAITGSSSTGLTSGADGGRVHPLAGWPAQAFTTPRTDRPTLAGILGADSRSGTLNVAPIAGPRAPGARLLSMVQDPSSISAVLVSASGAQNVRVVVDNQSYILPVAFDWKVGSSHQLTATDVFYPENATRAIFEGWSGSMTSSTQTLQVTIATNTQLTLRYRLQYLSSIAFTDFRGKSVDVQGVALKGPFGVIPLSANDTVWLDAGAAYSIWRATYFGVGVAPAGLFTASSPSTYSFSLPIYAQEIRVQDIFGLPIQGANVTLVSNGGVQLTKFTDNNGLAEFNQVPLGAFRANVSFLNVETTISAQTIGPHHVTATMALGYPLVSLVSIIGVLLGVEVIRRRRRYNADAHFFRT